MSGGENLLCFVDRSDPGLGGPCENMDKGGYDGEAEKKSRE